MKKAVLAVIFAVIALAILGLTGSQVYSRMSATTAAKEGRRGGVVAVEIAAVEKTAIRDVGAFTGTLVAQSRFDLAPKIAGRLERLLVNIGDTVKQGQLIASLDDAEYVQQVEQARAELDVAKAQAAECNSQMGSAERELARVITLREKHIASESELDAAQAGYDAADAKCRVGLSSVAQKEAALKAAQVRLSYTQIRAVWQGDSDTRVVGERLADEGAMLKANDPIVSLMDIGRLTGVLYVIERDYARISPGQRVVASTEARPGRTFEGKVARVAPMLQETARQARVEVDFPNDDLSLRPGMFVRAQIEFERRENATVVPIAALVTRNGKPGVFLVETDGTEKKARFEAVILGITSDPVVEVVSPILSGNVVTIGQHLLTDGGLVRLPDARREAGDKSSTAPPAGKRGSSKGAGGRS
jgi:RND family efflux transporter MFP subunit